MHMSDDELVAAIGSLVVCAFGWGRWYFRAAKPGPLVCPWSVRRPLMVVPVVCLALLLAVLLFWADAAVRTDPFYLFMYSAMGMAWVSIAMLALPALGIAPVQDVVERRNAAAAFGVSGAMLGLTLSFAGGNIGDGPGWWVVIFSAALGTAGMFAMWALLDVVTGISTLVTVERDTAAGVRLGALLTAMGAISGRAVAGDWISVSGTIEDFLNVAWPGVALVMVEGFFGLMARPTRERPRPDLMLLGFTPAFLYLGLAAGYIVYLGWWV